MRGVGRIRGSVMKIMFSVGEASGDLHAAAVARAINELYPGTEMFGMGGAEMRAAGVEIKYDIRDLGFIGVAEIIRKIPFFFRLRNELLSWIRREQPDVLVCVDYPGFNMKLAKAAKNTGVPIVYYIAPTVWAWHRSRGYDIARDTDAVACIFPFEEKTYREMGANATFVGHPLLDTVQPTMTKEAAENYFRISRDAKKIVLLPGSRAQEIEGLLIPMLGAVRELQKKYSVQCFLPRASTISREKLEKIIAGYEVPVKITESKTHDLMRICDLALAASGTVTLEAALMGLPTILLYRVAPLTYWLGRRLVQLDYIGLPNIIAGKEVIPELLQDDVNVRNIVAAVRNLWENPGRLQQMKADLKAVRERMGKPGAVERVAQLIKKTAEGETDA